MNYLQPNNKRNTRRFGPVLFVVICVIVVFGLLSLFPLFIPSVAQSIGRPLWFVGGFVMDHTSTLRGFFTSRVRLVEQNQVLQQRLDEAQYMLDTRTVIEQENKELKESWGRNTNTSQILASVLVKPPRTPYDTVVLDIGKEDGVVEGSRVIVGNTIALGAVDQVFDQSARARLFSSVDIRTNAFVSRNNITVELVGVGGGNFEIRVPQDLDIVEGDDIVLPGIIPYVVARVEAIESVPTDSFKRVFCSSPVRFSELRFVAVEKTS